MATTGAPGTLGLVQEFVNTADIESGQEDLAGPPELAAWLVERGLLAANATLSDTDVAKARSFREGLRSLMFANGGSDLDRAALATVNDIARSAPVIVNLTPEGALLEGSAEGIDATLGTLLGFVYSAMADGTWSRLKACQKESCKWAFYDHSRNHSRAWCSMQVCGNRVKARTYRERHSTEA